MPRNLVKAKFSRIERCDISADLRSPGTNEIPKSIASAGWLKETFFPLTKISPESGFASPANISKSKSCPWPSRAATPRTSPLRISKETSVKFFPPEMFFTSTRVVAESKFDLLLCLALATLFFSPSIAVTILSSLPLDAVKVSTSIPSRKTVARSQMVSISANRWEMKITDLPFFF
ncbi:unannotated protein [freshwater metagenome]|uniref:Unannotated protein n=2 Tax=freshwater metagenome TaxID=449393 RepID=A0A6J5Z0F7_9ZZZZ